MNKQQDQITAWVTVLGPEGRREEPVTAPSRVALEHEIRRAFYYYLMDMQVDGNDQYAVLALRIYRNSRSAEATKLSGNALEAAADVGELIDLAFSRLEDMEANEPA